MTNGMRLHTEKCVVIIASRSRSSVKYPYHLQGVVLREVHEVTDLGVSIAPCLDFRPHYSRCITNAMRTVGFISRFARHFRNIDTLKLLYVALVRPQVEYASIIWSPRNAKYIKSIESVQHRFLRFALRILGNPMDRYDHDYRPAILSLGLDTLEDRRRIADALFLYKITNGIISSPYLLSLVKFNAPVKSLRSRPLFVTSLPKYRFYACDSVNRAMCIVNQYYSSTDPFLGSLSSYRMSLHRVDHNLNGVM